MASFLLALAPIRSQAMCAKIARADHREGEAMTTDAQVSGTREQVLTEIRTAVTPPTVDEIAAALGLHRNSVRLHAAALQEAGLITQDGRATGGRGRPLAVYRPTPRGARAGGRNYEILAEMLVSHLATIEDHPEAAARAAGRAWGDRIATRHRHGPAGPGPGGGRELVASVLDEMGFEPREAGATIELVNCPFRELVDSHQGLICSLHGGMLEGLADGVSLLPLTSPSTCTVRLGER